MKKSVSYRFIQFFIIVGFTMFLFGACTEKEDLAEDPYEELYGFYSGISACTLKYYDEQGNSLSEEYFEYQSIFTAFPKTSYGMNHEANPFHIGLHAKVGQTLEGRLSLESAYLYYFDEPEILQYWDIDFIDNEIGGVLTNTNDSYTINFNAINVLESGAQEAVKKRLGVGTNLYGHLNKDKVSITVKGQTTDGFVRFEYRLDAERDN